MAVVLSTGPQDEQRRTRSQRALDRFAIGALIFCGVGLVVLTLLRLFGLG
jgi:hypothetical protein